MQFEFHTQPEEDYLEKKIYRKTERNNTYRETLRKILVTLMHDAKNHDLIKSFYQTIAKIQAEIQNNAYFQIILAIFLSFEDADAKFCEQN